MKSKNQNKLLLIIVLLLNKNINQIYRKVTVEEYIGDSWRNILSMHLCAIQKDEFESSKDDQEQLKKFVIESFKIVLDYELLDKDGVDVDLPGDKIKKTLDHITLGIKVHSVSKHDIVNTLDLKKLLR
ncbi:unnamed protein product [Rhizophagus irregularis]|nr:unnamed protein product [Rhizophagus irregularis]